MSSNLDTTSLNELMQFDQYITVHADGNITSNPEPCYINNIYDTFGAELDGSWRGWRLLTGFSNQHDYTGPLFHESEYIGGGLEQHIRTHPGKYVALIVYADDGGTTNVTDDMNAEDDIDIDGWVIAYRPLQPTNE